jgi:subfamily B ATP-binding cassette protein MsbA
VLYTFFSAFTLVSVIPFLDILFQAQAPSPPPPLSGGWDISGYKAHGYYMLHHWIVQEPNKMKILGSYCGILVVGIVLKGVGRYGGDYFMSIYEQGIVKNIRMHLFHHMTKLGLPFYTRHKKGDVMGLIISDIQVIQEAIIMTVMNLIREE